MRKLALILLLLPSLILLRAGNGTNNFTQYQLATSKKDFVKEMRQLDKQFNLDKKKLALSDVKKSEEITLPSKNTTAYKLDENQLVFVKNQLAFVGLVGEKFANDTLRFAALDTMKAEITLRLGEPFKLTANAVVWLTDSELYAMTTRNSRIYVTNIQREYLSDNAKTSIEANKFKYYDATPFDLTLEDISGFRNGMSKSAFAEVFKKKLRNSGSSEEFNLEDYLDLDNKQAANGMVKYSVDDTKALFMNDVLMLVSGFARPSLTKDEMDGLIGSIAALHKAPRIIANRYTWRNDDEGLDLIFDADIDERHNMIFIIGAPVFFKN